MVECRDDGRPCTIGLLPGFLVSPASGRAKWTEFREAADMISKVSFVRTPAAATIADVAFLLRPCDFPARSVVTRRGQPGDCMYFIVDGEVEILIEPKPVRLGPGVFSARSRILTGAPATRGDHHQSDAALSLVIADFRALAASRPELTDLIRKGADLRLGQVTEQESEDAGPELKTVFFAIVVVGLYPPNSGPFAAASAAALRVRSARSAAGFKGLCRRSTSSEAALCLQLLIPIGGDQEGPHMGGERHCSIAIVVSPFDSSRW